MKTKLKPVAPPLPELPEPAESTAATPPPRRANGGNGGGGHGIGVRPVETSSFREDDLIRRNAGNLSSARLERTVQERREFHAKLERAAAEEAARVAEEPAIVHAPEPPEYYQAIALECERNRDAAQSDLHAMGCGFQDLPRRMAEIAAAGADTRELEADALQILAKALVLPGVIAYYSNKQTVARAFYHWAKGRDFAATQAELEQQLKDCDEREKKSKKNSVNQKIFSSERTILEKGIQEARLSVFAAMKNAPINVSLDDPETWRLPESFQDRVSRRGIFSLLTGDVVQYGGAPPRGPARDDGDD